MLELGSSGAWVARNNGLLGMILAVYDDEPYVHMLPMHQVFADVQSVLQKDGKKPIVSLDLTSHTVSPGPN